MRAGHVSDLVDTVQDPFFLFSRLKGTRDPVCSRLHPNWAQINSDSLASELSTGNTGRKSELPQRWPCFTYDLLDFLHFGLFGDFLPELKLYLSKMEKLVSKMLSSTRQTFCSVVC